MKNFLQKSCLTAIVLCFSVVGFANDFEVDGIYYNINIKDANFDWYKLVNGVLKAIVISAVAIGMAFVFENKPELSEAVGVTPNFVINSAIILYVSKAIVSLGNILGIKIETKNKE